MAYLTISFKDYNMLWTWRPKLSLASESLIMLHHYVLSCTGSQFVSVLFLRFYCSPLRHSKVWLRRTWLSSSVLMFLDELSGLLTNLCWSSQRTSSNRLAWGLSQYAHCLRNCLPFEIKSSAPVPSFKAKPKNYLFRHAYFLDIGLVRFLGLSGFDFSKWRLLYINNSLHLARKYARIFVRGHYLFREANSFPRANLEENCELRGTDNVQGQISEHISVAKLRLLLSLIHIWRCRRS